MSEDGNIKILVVQRSLTHYRKLLLSRIAEVAGFEFVVYVMGGDEESRSGVLVVPFESKDVSLGAFGKVYQLQYSHSLVESIKEHHDDFDFIILEGATNILIDIAVEKCLRGRKPYIIWDAGRRKNARVTPLRRLAQAPLMRVWSGAAAIMAYSTLAKDYFVEQGIRPEKIFVCQNTLSVADFDHQIASLDEDSIIELRKRLGPGEQIVLYVGAIEPRKRVDNLLHAFGDVQKKISSVRLIVIGGGSDVGRLKALVNTEGITRVDFLGSIVDGVIPYFLACDLFVLPSEGGLSLNQAMICGKPVIASSADGTEYDLIKDGVNGYLFEEGDCGELALRMASILENSSLKTSMGVASRLVIDEKVNENRFIDSLTQCLKYVAGLSTK